MVPDPHKGSPLRDLLAQRWPAIEDAARTLVLQGDATIRPLCESRPGTSQMRALDALLAAGRVSSDSSRVRTEDVLGMGGMGIVHRGIQATLDRVVAVKSVRPDKRSPANTLKLLQEALVAGTLEHPNIVPVYDIGADADGEPLIVLQRIEGTEWADLLGDAARVREQFGACDLLEWNVRVLMQVCNAIHYAHSRGIVHLDLKPSNVMLGAFGEVLILDWGLAMSLRAEDRGRLPLASETHEIVGTPSYMAPEMLAQEGDLLDERTDVYLLGATLYEICTGEPPHTGKEMLAILFKIATETPPSPAGVPAELARICDRAMAPDPAARFQTARALRVALQEFLDHRGSTRLSEQATAQAHAIDAADDEAAVRALFSTARFGFQQALSAWPENPEARRGLADLLVGACRRALADGHSRQAAELLAELEAPPPALREDVQAALDDAAGRDDRMRSLQEFRDDLDLGIGQRTRAFLVGLLGVLFTLLPAQRVVRGSISDLELYRSYILSPVLFLLLFGGLLFWARESMARTAVNRRTAGSLITMLLFQITLTSIAWRIGVAGEQLISLLFVLWAGFAAMFTINVDRRTLPMTLGYIGGLGAAIAWPSAQWWFVTAANAIFTINAVVIWWPRPFLDPRRAARSDS